MFMTNYEQVYNCSSSEPADKQANLENSNVISSSEASDTVKNGKSVIEYADSFVSAAKDLKTGIQDFYNSEKTASAVNFAKEKGAAAFESIKDAGINIFNKGHSAVKNINFSDNRQDNAVSSVYEVTENSGNKQKIVLIFAIVFIGSVIAVALIIHSGNKSETKSENILNTDTGISSNIDETAEDYQKDIEPKETSDKETGEKEKSEEKTDYESADSVAVEIVKIAESDQYQNVPDGSDRSRTILGNYLSDLYAELISSDAVVMGHPEDFYKNEFSICDVDFDGEAELLVKITTGCMAANGIHNYKADEAGNVVKEGYTELSSVFFANGFVVDPASHNQEGSSPVWPYSVLKYNSQNDSYDYTAGVSSWSKSAPAPLSVKGQDFPDEADTSSTGVVYFISSPSDVSYEHKTPKDYSEYVKWYNSWNQGSPKLNIVYESFSEDNIKKYNPSYKTSEEIRKENEYNNQSYNSNDNQYIGKGYVSTSGDELFVRSSPEIINSPGTGNKIDCFADGTELSIDYSRTSGTDDWIYVTGKALSGKTVTGYVFREFVRENSDSGVDVTSIYPYINGEISSNGYEIEGYTTDYVCDGGAKTRQWVCEDKWHITAKRTVYSYGVQWYECWDTDDGDYYGWIDGDFLYFY